jgi:periplasmic protein TonB
LFQSAYLHEGLDFPDFLETGDDHGFGWLHHRTWWRRSSLMQSVMVSIFVHLVVLAVFVFTPNHVESVKSPWLDVRLVSLGTGEVAAGSGSEGGSGGGSAVSSPVAEKVPLTEIFPSEPVPQSVEKPSEKDPKPTVNPAAARLRPASKPKESPKTPVSQKEACDSEPLSAASSQPTDAAASPSGISISTPALGESGDGNSGAGGAHGRGLHGGHGGGPVEAEFGVGNGPRFAHKSVPKYPRLARQLGKEGVVVLRVTINETGRPIVVEVVKTAGSGFDEEAIRAVKESLFHPAKREGKPVLCRAVLPIRFELRGSD